MKELQENLQEEQHGTMPEFINKKRWNKRMAVIALTMLTQIVAAMLYISYPNEKVNISAIIFLLASIGMKKLLTNSANWYVTKKDVTLKTIRTTMIAQKCLVLAALTAWVLIAFTPIWCILRTPRTTIRMTLHTTMTRMMTTYITQVARTMMTMTPGIATRTMPTRNTNMITGNSRNGLLKASI